MVPGSAAAAGCSCISRIVSETIYINYYHMSGADPEAISFDSGRDRNTAKSVLVPGTAAGLCLALEDYGTLPLPVAIEPALRYARDGFPVDTTLAGLLLDNMEKLGDISGTRRRLHDRGVPHDGRGSAVQPDLARVLQLISDYGRDGFYKGETATALADGLTAGGGVMTMADLDAYVPVISKPVRGTYRGLEIVAAPPPHSGVTLIQIMNMIEQLELDPKVHFSESAEDIHMMSEIFRRCYADRSEYLGDPRFVATPETGLMSKTYACDILAGVNRYKADPRNYRDTPYGFPSKYCADAPAAVGAEQQRKRKLNWQDEDDQDPGLNPGFENDRFDRWRKEKAATAGSNHKEDEFDGGHTTHLSVIDADGNMVALTQTLGNFFGSTVMIKGILLNNGRVNFSSVSSANLIEPFKRPRSSITPTLLFKDGKPFMSLGSPGAGRIIATVAEIVVNIVDYGMDVEAANAAPRFFCQKFDDHLFVESRISDEVRDELTRMGHSVRALGSMDLFFGGVQMVAIWPPTGELVGSADPRRGGSSESLDQETAPDGGN